MIEGRNIETRTSPYNDATDAHQATVVVSQAAD